MDYREITREQRGGRLTLMLHRPQTLNALTQALREELLDALKESQENAAIRVVVLSGAGRAFSVGQDLKEMQQYYEDHGPALGRLIEESYIPLVQALRQINKPTIAVLEGAAVGGGMALALAADFRVILNRAQLVPGFVNVGLAPDTGVTFLLGRAVGYARALSLCLMGQPIAAEAMVALGLAARVNESPESLQEELDALSQHLEQGPTLAYAAIRQLFDQAAHQSWEQTLWTERDVQERLAHTVDHAEAVQAFLTKRTPHFQGQ